MTTPAWIGLGSNLGDREATLGAAIAALADSPGVVVEAVSPCHETKPVGGPPGQGAFLNAALRLRTDLEPLQLLEVTQDVENRLGRVRAARWGERTLDIDLLVWGDLVLDSPRLILPHPRIALRRFVLVPLAELDPSLVEPMTGRAISDLLSRLDRTPRLLAIDGVTGRRKSSVLHRLAEALPAIATGAIEAAPDQSLEFARRAEALRDACREAEALRIPWLAADFSLHLDLLRASTGTAWVEAIPAGEWRRMVDDREGMHAARIAASGAPEPTFIVALPGESEVGRRPGLLEVPLLRPESDSPDAIVDEVLATCRSIEAG